VTQIECPECGARFEVDPSVVFLSNRFYCSVCDALLEVLEEEPLILESVEDASLEEDNLDLADDEVWDE
jgi:lysine biosynthesis protein LysW